MAFWELLLLAVSSVLPFGLFSFCAVFLFCFERADVYTQCHVFSSVLGKGTSTGFLDNVEEESFFSPSSDFQKVTGNFSKVTLFILPHKSFNAVKSRSEI